MRIVIDPLSKDSISAAIKTLKTYKKDFVNKEREFVRRLAEIGVNTATGIFSIADYDGVKDVTVRIEETANGYAVIADGSTVGFIEFGTGIKYPEWDNSGMEYTPPKHGTYGKGLGNNPHGWYFTQSLGAKAVHTYGNPPAEAMLSARDIMVQRVIQIAREVWK
jgi:hypothetical protein